MSKQKDKDSEAGQAPVTPAASYSVTDLETLKVLADPLRIRILECFCRDEYTTKQVAEKLKEKPTRLYHHVDALQRVGLIRLTRTQQNRGTLEKYYRAVARRFEADASLFTTADTAAGETAEGLSSMTASILTRTSEELSALIAAGHSARGLKEDGLFSFIEIRAGKERIRRLRKDLKSLLEEIAEACESPSSDSDQTEKERYRLTLALFPLPE